MVFVSLLSGCNFGTESSDGQRNVSDNGIIRVSIPGDISASMTNSDAESRTYSYLVFVYNDDRDYSASLDTAGEHEMGVLPDSYNVFVAASGLSSQLMGAALIKDVSVNSDETTLITANLRTYRSFDVSIPSEVTAGDSFPVSISFEPPISELIPVENNSFSQASYDDGTGAYSTDIGLTETDGVWSGNATLLSQNVNGTMDVGITIYSSWQISETSFGTSEVPVLRFPGGSSSNRDLVSANVNVTNAVQGTLAVDIGWNP